MPPHHWCGPPAPCSAEGGPLRFFGGAAKFPTLFMFTYWHVYSEFKKGKRAAPESADPYRHGVYSAQIFSESFLNT